MPWLLSSKIFLPFKIYDVASGHVENFGFKNATCNRDFVAGWNDTELVIVEGKSGERIFERNFNDQIVDVTVLKQNTSWVWDGSFEKKVAATDSLCFAAVSGNGTIYLGGQNIDDSWEIESLQLEKQFIQARIFTMNKNCFVIVYENDDRVNFDLVIQKNTLSLYSENNKLIKGKIVSVEAQYNLISILLKNNDKYTLSLCEFDSTLKSLKFNQTMEMPCYPSIDYY
ncbi:hypothetical protein O9G_002124 [Rozella allomycis CSF55]|uniref:Uncharacterized protein n=1 Tax=Rozella allomycis (strain CSF55) TaxID=988480 RepID=A0A075B517_ROZAC|nr:hypothetical protein O9G_002124 [Rozella allomycis CSF55]|eukprot:EPZ36841.1 hypothetical protein O9G_002124 [Rozella allomycis CSF55]